MAKARRLREQKRQKNRKRQGLVNQMINAFSDVGDEADIFIINFGDGEKYDVTDRIKEFNNA